MLKELIEHDEQINALPLFEAIEESVRTLQLQTKGGIVKPKMKGAKDFVGKNPLLAVGAAALALNALGQYQKNKRNMIKLHGKTHHEKKLMTDIVKKITADGLWSLHRVKFEGGGKSWYLERKVKW